MKFVSFIVLMIIILLSNSCLKDEYLYLSEEEKSYLFYDTGDTLKFVYKMDTLLGCVSQKKFDMVSGSSSYYSSNSDIHSEYGKLKIISLKSGLLIVYIEIMKYEKYAELSYQFSVSNINNEIHSCSSYSGAFTSKIIDNELTQYSSTQYQDSILNPVFDNTYELAGTNSCDFTYKLHLRKHIGFTSLLVSETDSIIISKQRKLYKFFR